MLALYCFTLSLPMVNSMFVRMQAIKHHYCSYSQTQVAKGIIAAFAFTTTFVAVAITTLPWVRTLTIARQVVIVIAAAAAIVAWA